MALQHSLTLMPKPLLVGITGNIGSGKSTAARLLLAKGAALIDSDELARAATRDPEVLKRIASELAPDLVKDGQLDRAKTAALVFNNEFARQTLNQIIHPWVRRKTAEAVAALSQQDPAPTIILLDIPLLYENALDKGLDAVIVVDAPFETRLERVRARSGLSEAEFRARDAAQIPLAEKVKRANFVIDNSEGLRELKEQISSLWPKLLELRPTRHPS